MKQTISSSNWALLRNFAARPFVASVAAVYGGYLFRFISPLIVVPLIARRLGPAIYGKVMLASAIGVFVTMVIEFGFQAHGTRELSYNSSKAHLRTMFSTISSTKIIITVVLFAIGVLLQRSISGLRHDPLYFWGGFAMGCANAINLVWLYQGENKLGAAMIYDVYTAFISAVLIVLIVRGPSSGPAVLIIQAGASLLTGLAAHVIVARRVGWEPPTLSAVRSLINNTMSLFIARASTSMYLTLSVILLGILSNDRQVAAYGAAERIILLVINTLYPLGQVVFPRIVRAYSEGDNTVSSQIAAFLLTVSFLAAAAAAAIIVLSPSIIGILYGKHYISAVIPLCLLSVTIPLAAVNQALASQVLIASSRDGAVTVATIAGGAMNIFAAVLLTGHMGAAGMAISRIVSEATVTMFILVGVRSSPLMPTRAHATAVLRSGFSKCRNVLELYKR